MDKKDIEAFGEETRKIIREQYKLTMKLALVTGVIMIVAMLAVFHWILKVF